MSYDSDGKNSYDDIQEQNRELLNSALRNKRNIEQGRNLANKIQGGKRNTSSQKNTSATSPKSGSTAMDSSGHNMAQEVEKDAKKQRTL